jgi:hypothetical protein
VSLYIQRRFLLVGVEPQTLRAAHWRELAARQNCRLSRSEKNQKFKIPLPGRQENFQKFQIAGCKNAFPDAYPLRGGFSNRRTAQGTKCEVCADRRNQKSLSAKGAKTPFSPATPWEDVLREMKIAQKQSTLVVQIVESKKFDGRGYQNAFLVGYPLRGLFPMCKPHRGKAQNLCEP